MPAKARREHRAEQENEASRPGRAESIDATIGLWELEDEQELARIAWFQSREAAANRKYSRSIKYGLRGLGSPQQPWLLRNSGSIEVMLKHQSIANE